MNERKKKNKRNAHKIWQRKREYKRKRIAKRKTTMTMYDDENECERRRKIQTMMRLEWKVIVDGCEKWEGRFVFHWHSTATSPNLRFRPRNGRYYDRCFLSDRLQSNAGIRKCTPPRKQKNMQKMLLQYAKEENLNSVQRFSSQKNTHKKRKTNIASAQAEIEKCEK